MSHSNVAVFIPHVGCPNKCSFCNQNSISGTKRMPTTEEVSQICEQALLEIPKENLKDAQLAFFGGSFTAIPRETMISYLEATKPFIGEGKIPSIRLSTRPDAIDQEILDILKSYGVKSIELGCQSMNQNVLDLNRRGHKAEDTINSANLIKKNGFELGVQMMIGLYGDESQKSIETARILCSLKPKTARIYPTIVIKDTYLEKLYNEGKYVPLSLDEAVKLSAEILEIFNEANVNVIRLGLHSEESLKRDMVAGPFHDAFRELCEGEMFFKKALSILEKSEKKGSQKDPIILFVSPKSVSKMIGQKRINIKRLNEMGYFVKVKEDCSLGQFSVKATEEVKL